MQAIKPGPMAPFFILLNAGSGSAETQLQRSTIEDVLVQAGRAFRLVVVDAPEKLGEVAQRMVDQARQSNGIVVAAGGDGTINAVARKTVASGCPFGVLPQGTFNYFARTHGIPEDLGEAVRALLSARIEPVQVGMVNDRIFLVNASIGLYPKLLEERELDKQQYGRSRLVAFLSALKTALSPHRNLRIRLEMDGKARTLRTSTLFVGNNRLQMEQVGIAPQTAAPEDGKLIAIAPKSVGKLGLLGLLVRGVLGRLGEADNLVAFSFKQMTVRHTVSYGKRRIKVATDGEVSYLQTPLEFCALEGQLLLLKPESAPQPQSTPAGTLDTSPLTPD
ncbi:MAG: diacylglycerol kinase family protein [Telluria sp.]|nr:diacylglycerol kinase family protein [Telluria sp.]